MLENNCPYGDDDLVVAAYLAGRLSTAKTEAFEAHSFGCDRCFGELQRATELRAANQERLATGNRAHYPVPRSRIWPSLAVAATVALAIGVWISTPLVDDEELVVEPVYRDTGDDEAEKAVLHLTIERNGDSVSLSWTGVQGVDQYQLRILTEAGDPVFEQLTSHSSIELSAVKWQGAGAPGKFYVQVIALDQLRQIIVQSDFEPL